MEEKEHNKISRLYQFLQFANQYSRYQYGGFDKSY